MQTVLVTGGAGYIGSQACKSLRAAGFEPVVFDNLVTGHEWAVKWGPLEVGDMRSPDDLDRVFSKYAPAATLHFAAFACPRESMSDPAKYYANNISGMINVLDAMLRHDCRYIVFSSSCAVYGAVDRLPVAEQTPPAPISPYGWTKFMGERMLEQYGRAYGTRFTALRYFNAAGADLDGELGEDHVPETHFLPNAIAAALGKTGRMSLNGTDHPTPDGAVVRDFVHVADLADAHVRALGRLLKGGENVMLNLGAGRGYSLAEVLRIIETITGRKVPVENKPRLAADPPMLYADITAARKTLAWKPQHSDIETIVSSALQWHERRLLLTTP